MLKSLNVMRNARRLIVSGAVLTASSLAHGIPVNSKVNNCTFVDAIVSSSTVFGTGNTPDETATEAVNDNVVRVPGRVAVLRTCGVVHFSTETESAREIGTSRNTTQKFLRMATLFESHNDSDRDLIRIFDFVQPIANATHRDKLQK